MFLLGQWEKELLLSARVTDSELSVQHTALIYLNFFYIHENRLLCLKMEKKRVGGFEMDAYLLRRTSCC